MVLVDAPGQADNHAARVLVPVRGAQTGERGDHIASVGVLHFVRHVFGIGRAVNQAQLVAQPLKRSARYKDGAFQRIVDLAPQAPCDGRDQAVLGEDRLLPGVHQHEATGAVGVLRLARRKAGLPEQSRLLVPGRARNRNRSAEDGGVRLSVHAAGRLYFRKHAGRDVQLFEDVFVPLQLLDVEQHGAGGIGIVGHMYFAFRQVPNQPGIHRAEQQLALFGPLPHAGHVLKNPAQLCPRKIGVNHEARLLAEDVRQALGLELVAVLRRAPALPDDGVVDRLARLLVPDNRRFALVRDADCSDVLGRGIDLIHGFLRHADLGRPDFHGVVFHPSELGEILPELLLRHADHFSPLIEENTAGARRPCIQGHDVLCHLKQSLPQRFLIGSSGMMFMQGA